MFLDIKLAITPLIKGLGEKESTLGNDISQTFSYNHQNKNNQLFDKL